MEPDTHTIEPEDLSFAELRTGLLRAVAEEEGLAVHVVLREYNHNTEFKRRIDAAAMSLLLPTSRTVH
jgi:hypothetical protein